MSKKIIIDANYPGETRVVLLDKKNQICELDYETSSKQQIKGNIYLAKIVRVEPSLQAAFIEYQGDKNGFLPFSEIHPDYYHIPASDKIEDENISSFSEITPPEITAEEKSEKVNNKKVEVEIDFKLDGATIADDLNGEDLGLDNKNSFRDYKIQDVIRKGQIVLVQAQKEERGNKGAALSTYISLAGKYCVLLPNRPEQNGISKKIVDLNERRRLRDIVSELSGSDNKLASIIVRTAGVNRTRYEVKKDYEYLAKLWNKIREKTLKSIAPAFIHMEDGIILKTIRNLLDQDVETMVIQGKKKHQELIDHLNELDPSEISKVKEYNSKTPIFTKFSVEEQLSNMYQPTVALPSGGSVVIHPTEALISIDVNSGKATAERDIEETAVKTNVEAAQEIARQLKLRDLSGLIVIDFIDMYESKNRKQVEKTIMQSFVNDRARIQTGEISNFGLFEMSRQRLRPSFLESNTKMCHYCNGKGIVRADASNAILVLRTIENELYNSNVKQIKIHANPNVVSYLLNDKRSEIADLERKHNISIHIMFDQSMHSDGFMLEKIGKGKSKPVREERSKPVREERSKPVREERSKPVRGERSKPIREERSKSVREERSKPVIEERRQEGVDNTQDSRINDEDKKEIKGSSSKKEVNPDAPVKANKSISKPKVGRKPIKKQ